MDNLNTHSIASLYQTLPPEKAYALGGRFEIHHTPKHGSWLNIAEIELSCLTKQCLGRRIPELEVLNEELAACARATNADERQVDWRFTTATPASNSGTHTQPFRSDGLLVQRKPTPCSSDPRTPGCP